MGEIREDQKTTLYFKTVDNIEKEFDCFIKEVHDDRISLRFPSDILDYANYIEEGAELPVKIFTPTGVKAFNTIVINSPIESEFVIEFVEDYIHIQRREYLRVELETKVILDTEDFGVTVTKTLDVSGGGMRFASDKPFRKGQTVKIMLYLPFQENSVKALGEIVECAHLPENEHVLAFTQIDERERGRIVKQCFDMQSGAYR